MIAIIGAMQVEVDEILKLATKVKKIEVNNHSFYQAEINGKECVITISGIGKVNASMATTTLLNIFEISKVINIGTAGGLKDYEQVLDIVIGSRVTYHDLNVPGWPKSFDIESENISTKYVFKSDKDLISASLSAIKSKKNVYIGDILTGDTFVTKNEVNQIIKDYPSAIACEMEAAAIAHVCDKYEIPFVVIRSLSDITIKDGNDITFDEYVKLASKRSAIFVADLILTI